jgi:hypothetical protein
MHKSITGVIVRNTRRRLMTPSRVLATLAVLPLCAGTAMADVKFKPHATVGYESESNLFQINETDPIALRLDSDGQPRASDTSISYGGGLDINGSWGEQKASLTTSLVRSVYDHFDQLNRNDKLLGLGINWVATHKISGTVNARYDENLVPFTDLAVPVVPTSNLIQIDRVVGVSANYLITSKWTALAELGYSRRTVPATVTGNRYDLQQTPKTIGVRYGGTAQLTVGLNVDTNEGKYIGAGDVPDFHSTRYQGTVDYTISPRTSLNANYGYTKFSQTGGDSNANVGGITFNQQLTVKTKYYLRYNRSLDVYPTTQGSQVSNTASGGISWQALRKVGLSADYAVAKATVKSNVALAGVVDASRKDTLKSTQAAVTYNILPWFNISPYYRYQERTSEIDAFEFHDKVYGITLDARYP